MYLIGFFVLIGVLIIGSMVISHLKGDSKEGIIVIIQKSFISTMLFLILVVFFNGSFFYAEPGYTYHVRTILGNESAVKDVGYNMNLFGKYTPWKNAMTVQAIAVKTDGQGDTSGSENDEKTSATLGVQNIMFVDQVDADAQATVRFRIPTDEKLFLDMVREYRSPSNLLNTGLIPAFKETLQATASLMSAEEYFAGGRTGFINEFGKQMVNGIYIVKRIEKEVKAKKRLASANAAKGGEQDIYGENVKTIFVVEKQVDKNGVPLRKKQTFVKFGISIVDTRITHMIPNTKFEKRMELKQEASADMAIAIQGRVKEEQQKLFEIAKGEKDVAVKQAEAKVEQIKFTTQAETRKQLAITNANALKEKAQIEFDTALIKFEQAKIDADKIKVLADAESYKKKVILKADNALAQKLKAYIETQKVWAEAFSKRAVPKQVFGGSGKGGSNSDSDVTTFMNLMTVKAATDLSVDTRIDKK